MYFPWKDDLNKELYSSNVYKGALKANEFLKKYLNNAPNQYGNGQQGGYQPPYQANNGQPPYPNNSSPNQQPYHNPVNGNPPPPQGNNGVPGGGYQPPFRGNPVPPPYNNGAPGSYQPPFRGNRPQPPYNNGAPRNYQQPPYQNTTGGYRPNTNNSTYKTEYVVSDDRARERQQAKQEEKQKRRDERHEQRQQRRQAEDAIKNDPDMIMKRKRSLVPYAVSLIFLGVGVSAMFYNKENTNVWAGVAAVSVMSVGLFLLCRLIFRGKKIWVPKPVEVVRTGDSDVDKMFEDGMAYLEQLKKADVDIEDEEISAQIVRMEEITKNILAFVKDNPKKAPQIRKFLSYYLPTTLKLLNSYHKLSSQGVQGENISSTMFNIKGMMHTIVVAFEKQLDALFQDEAMDISTDITVLEGMLTQEGLNGSDFKSNDK